MNSPKVGVGVLIIDKGRVLLGKRKGSHGAGTWAAPGGHLEFGETVENCAEREVMEEVGIKIRDLQHGPFANNVFQAERKHYVTIFVLAKPGTGIIETKEPEKCEKWQWFDWSNLPEPLFPPLDTLQRQGFTLPPLFEL